MAYQERNDVVKATELLKECLLIREKNFSATHPHLLAGTAHFIQHGVID